MATNTAASFSTPTANGTAGPFNIGFTYLAQSEIDVTVDGVLKTLNTHYIFHSATQISFTSGNFPTAGQSIRFQRNTDISAKKVDFQNGSVLTETDLDNNTDQVLFGLQEFVDELNTNVVKRDGTQTITNNLVFEGSSDDANETTLGVVNPTADRTINLPNVSGTVVTTGDTGTVSNGMIADDAVNAAKISETDLKSLSNCQTGSAASLANLTNNEVLILDGATLSTTELNTLDGVNSTLTASELNVLDGITASTANLNQLTNKEVETSITANSDAKIPTSKAVNDRILTVTNALGGFVAIANETSFPSTHPDPSSNAGTVVSVSDAGGVVVNSSGVATITNGAGTGNTVTITGFPSDLHSKTLGSGVGLQVQTTTTLHTYTYHKVLLKESDLINLSNDIDDFGNRYRVVETTPTSNNDEGDLIFRKSDNKLLVFNGTAYQEASSVGNFHTNTLSSFNGTGGGSATFNGSAYRFNIDHPPELAEQLLVSINGVVQKPNSGTSQPSEGFAISGSSVIFSAAPASGSDFFIITIGKSIDIGTPSDDTVSTAKLQDNAVTGAKIADNLDIPDNNKIRFGTSNDLQIYHNGSHSFIQDVGTGELILASNGFSVLNAAANESIIETSENGAVELYYDNSKKFETTSYGAAVTGGINFSGDSLVQDNVSFFFGASSDLQIVHNGTNSVIKNTTGYLNINSGQFAIGNQDNSEFYLAAVVNQGVELRYDNVKKFETTSTGITASGTQHIFTSGTSGDCELIIAADSDNNNENDNPRILFRQDGSLTSNSIGVNHPNGNDDNDLYIANGGFSGDIVFYTGYDSNNQNNYTAATQRLKITTDGNVQIPNDTGKLQLGASQDLELYHSGNNSFIKNSGVGFLALLSDQFTFNNEANTENIIQAFANGAVNLYYDNSKKLETTSTGATVTGALNVDGIQISLSNNDAIIDAPTGDEIFLRANGGSDRVFAGRVNSQVELFYDNVEKFRTTSTGISVTGGIVGSADATINGVTVGKGANNQAGNTVVGENALDSNSTGGGNVAVGYSALGANTTGQNNIAIGYSALDANTTSNNNVAIGLSALGANTAGDNTAVGIHALKDNTSGTANVAVGTFALLDNTTGSSNTGLGHGALGNNTTGIQNVAVGRGSLATSNANNNTAVGYNSLNAETTGSNNTAVGHHALLSNTTGTQNNAFGRQALDANTTGNHNSAFGVNTLGSNTTGSSNIAYGSGALQSNTFASNNTAVGYQALNTNTTGHSNVAVGTFALDANTTGSANIGIGYGSLSANTTANNNTAVGYDSLRANTSGIQNVAFGNYVLDGNSTGTNNTGLGYNCLTGNTTASNNTAVGSNALRLNTTGAENVALGKDALLTNTTGADNVAVGSQALINNTTGSDNTAVGRSALYANSTGDRNTAVGNVALASNTTGQQNTAVGDLSARYNTTGQNNVSVGYYSLNANQTGSDNVAVGQSALDANLVGNSNVAVGMSALTQSTASENVAIGRQAQFGTTTGTSNVAVGTFAMNGNSTGSNNIAIGRGSLGANTTASNNTAVGYVALLSNTTGQYNVAVGANALDANTTGTKLTAVGRHALSANTTADENTAFGYGALAVNTTGSLNVAIGSNALDENTTASQNVAVGYNSMQNNSTGEQNTGVGTSSLYTNDTGNYNVGLGKRALYTNSTGSYNVAVGTNTLDANTTADNNTAIGYQALGANSTGTSNVAVGANALDANTTGDYSTAIGSSALSAATSATQNTAVGTSALLSTTTGTHNVALGNAALRNNTTGTKNVAVGNTALRNNTTAEQNTSVGYNSLTSNTTGEKNTAVGHQAGQVCTTGSKNTLIGREAGLTLTTGDNNVLLGYNAGRPTISPFGVTTESNRIVLGDNDITNAYIKVAFTVTSDKRDKIEDGVVSHGLDFVNQLKPKSFWFRKNRESDEKTGDKRYGFFAQDILALEGSDAVVIDNNDPENLKYKGEQLIPILVKAIQELTMELNKLKSNG